MCDEASINERVNSQLYSDVISSYVDINQITAQRNIVPGSLKETVVQCTDQTLATLNSAGGQTLFTRFKLTPAVRNATLAQLAQIYFQYVIPKNSLGIMTKNFSTLIGHAANGKESTADAADNIGTGATQIDQKLHFKLFYDSGASLASMIQLCLTADAKVSTENFNYQQTLLTLNSLPDYATDLSNSENTLKGLVEQPNYHGVGSGLIEVNLKTANANQYVVPINQDIVMEGLIDLDKSNPLFHNFPIITRNMQELYVRLYMENFLRELKIVYLDKARCPGSAKIAAGSTIQSANGNFSALNAAQFTTAADVAVNIGLSGFDYLPYQRLPADKPDFVYLDGKCFKVKLVNMIQNNLGNGQAAANFNQTNPIYTLTNINWTRFEIRKVEFDIEEFEDVKASQGRAGTYKFPVHLFRSKNFDQTNAASSSANALQTTLNAPNIDRIFITQPWSRDYYTHLPTLPTTDINPQLHNNPILPRTEDSLNIKSCERIAGVFTDTDKFTPSSDLYNSLFIPTLNKQLQLKSGLTYGGTSAFEYTQRGWINKPNIYIPNKFAYAIECNEGGCFRRGFNSVIDGNYSPTVPVNLQQSLQTSNNLYYDNGAAHGATSPFENVSIFDTAGQENAIVNTNGGFNSVVSYGNVTVSGAVASIHCLCDYIFWFAFDQFGNMTDFGVSEYNDRA